MAITKHEIFGLKPCETPKLYMTCLTNPNYLSVRWWDGKEWWDISASRGSSAKPFKWPRGTAANGISQPSWMKRYPVLRLRKINDQGKVRIAVPYKHFEPAEVLKHLVDTGRLMGAKAGTSGWYFWSAVVVLRDMVGATVGHADPVSRVHTGLRCSYLSPMGRYKELT